MMKKILNNYHQEVLTIMNRDIAELQNNIVLEEL